MAQCSKRAASVFLGSGVLQDFLGSLLPYFIHRKKIASVTDFHAERYQFS